MRETKMALQKNKKTQHGAALVTVLFISLLLLTASAAMLTAIGANSRNTTDILSETKAYYAAETGLQATVNVLRNFGGTGVPYTTAIGDPDLSTWLPAYVSGQVPIGTGTGTGYSVDVSNPDTGSITYATGGKFTSTSAGELDGQRICIPDCGRVGGIGDWSVITLAGTSGAPSAPNTLVSTFTYEKGGAGADEVLSDAAFRIDYRLLTPRFGVASIYGKMTQADAGSPINITFQSRDYRLLGSTVQLCSTQTTGCGMTTLTLDDRDPQQFFATSTTAFNPSPNRLKVLSTGYGPNGAKKQLEAIVRRNLFDGFDPQATLLLIGPHNDAFGGVFQYASGNSSGVGYLGCDCDISDPMCSPTLCIPAFGVTDQLNLNDLIAGNGGVNVNPGPQLVEFANLPPWVQTPAALDELIGRLRVTAQHSNRYFNVGGGNISFPNSWSTTGIGITFCEGSCKVNESGGGILVVTGRLTYKGSVDFKGFIIVTGQEGWNRDGGGSGKVTANIVIAPYNRLVSGNYVYPNPVHSTSFLAPRYDMGGGGASIVPGSDINPFLDNTSAVSDLVVGVAEK